MLEHNRSLTRGIDILMAFRPGVDLLGNGEIAERTQLSKATVSRLTQTLVACGMLEHDVRQKAYRLAAPVLSLGFAMKSSSPVLNIAAPKMRSTSERLKVNVGLAVPDQIDMIYLESIRYQPRAAFRNIVAGLRVPMELTSLGRAWLAHCSAARKRELFRAFKARRSKDWTRIREEIDAAQNSIKTQDFCWASWQPGVLAVATALPSVNGQHHVLNISKNDFGSAPIEPMVNALASELLALKRDIVLTLI